MKIRFFKCQFFVVLKKYLKFGVLKVLKVEELPTLSTPNSKYFKYLFRGSPIVLAASR